MAVRRRWKILGGIGIGTAVTVGLVVAAARIPFSSDTLRKRLVATLADRLDSEVELDALTLRLSPTVAASGTGLRIYHEGRRDVPPLISIDAFAVSASLTGLWRRRVDLVRVDGLDIKIPPGRRDNKDKDGDDQPNGSLKEDPSVVLEVPAHSPAAGTDARNPSNDTHFEHQVVISHLFAPEARLMILRRDTEKEPKTWYLHSLHVQEVGLDTAMPFESVLTNALPPGQIRTKGSFGPWQRDEPGRTPLNGDFTFANADLSVFKGISGTLSAMGRFAGQLARIEVDGQTHTPDFMINISGHALPLQTTYHAVVDGTNGNTTLDPVNATFAQTSLVAKGGVYDVKGGDGRIVKLDVEMESGRLEDVMRLAVNTPRPAMVGRLHLITTLTLPPGKIDVVEKLRLRGRFRIDDGRFTDPGVQGKVNQLSRRASGKTSDAGDVRKVTSDFRGRFNLGGGRLEIPTVTFDVPGALVEMSGAYGMRAETIAFDGNLFMDAKISETMTGFKSLLLKLADPLFRREGRTVIPLKVDGTRNDPHFGLDIKRVFRWGEGKKGAPAKSNVKPQSATRREPPRPGKPG